MSLAMPALDVLHAIGRRRGGRGEAASEPVFQLARGAINPNCLSQCFAIYARKAGLEGVGVHGLRHAAVTRLIECGVPVPIVQQFAGHADVATTMRY